MADGICATVKRRKRACDTVTHPAYFSYQVLCCVAFSSHIKRFLKTLPGDKPTPHYFNNPRSKPLTTIAVSKFSLWPPSCINTGQNRGRKRRATSEPEPKGERNTMIRTTANEVSQKPARKNFFPWLLLALLAMLTAGSAQAEGRKRASDDLSDQLQQAASGLLSQDSSSAVIIQFTDKPVARHFNKVSAQGGSMKHSFGAIKGGHFNVSRRGLAALANDPDIAYISPD